VRSPSRAQLDCKPACGASPQYQREVELLLEFAQEEEDRTDQLDRKIFANVLESLPEVGRNIEKKARAEAYSDAFGQAAQAVGKTLLNLVDMKSQSTEPKKTPVAARMPFPSPWTGSRQPGGRAEEKRQRATASV
jgi:hypothetical protein